jgi:hypothetical protein
MSKNVELRDLGWKRIQRDLRQLNGKEITVGFHKDAGTHESGESFAFIASTIEYGKENRDGSKQPERPALRNAFNQSQGMLRKKIKNNVQAIYRGGSVMGQLKLTAAWFAAINRGGIFSFSSPGNADSTIKQKGFDDPWIWGFDLVNALDWKVR